nr:MAG TPA: hypothetical protein [Bacteriophage sp.]
MTQLMSYFANVITSTYFSYFSKNVLVHLIPDSFFFGNIGKLQKVVDFLKS